MLSDYGGKLNAIIIYNYTSFTSGIIMITSSQALEWSLNDL
jgi:hypothetical protein